MKRWEKSHKGTEGRVRGEMHDHRQRLIRRNELTDCLRACSAAWEISDSQSNLFVSAGFPIAVAVRF
jgi:hypothetical protein